MSFAFGKRAAILDTNVARVLYRVFVGRGDARSHAMKNRLWEISRTVLPHRHVFDFNQALMDFGATVCSAQAVVPDMPALFQMPGLTHPPPALTRTAQDAGAPCALNRWAMATSFRCWRPSSSVTDDSWSRAA